MAHKDDMVRLSSLSGGGSSLERRLAFCPQLWAIFGMIKTATVLSGLDGGLVMDDKSFFQKIVIFLIVFGGGGDVFALPPRVAKQHAHGRQPQLNALFIDSALHEEGLYAHPLHVFKQLGWRATFCNVTDLLTKGVDATFDRTYGVFVFSLGLDFWRAKRGSHVRMALCEAITKALNTRGAITLFAVPDSLGTNASLLDSSLDGFFTDVGLNEFAALGSASGRELTRKLKSFLSTPLTVRSALYDTSLKVVNPGVGGARLPQTHFKTSAQDMAISLPYWNDGRFSAKGVLSPLIPLGFLLFSQRRQQSFVFMPESILKTLGVMEDFLVFPVKHDLQRDFEKIVHAFWVDIDSWARYSGSFERSKIEALFRRGWPKKGLQTVFSRAGEDESREKKKVTGWMELVVFERGPEEYESAWQKKCVRQRELIDGILDARLEYLWVSLSPQMYYGDHAKCPEKKGQFEAGFKRFCRMLKTAAKDRFGGKMPALLVGFEIANNLYEPHLPAEYAIDIFGNTYRDVPSPISKRFWRDEVEVPFQRFMAFVRTIAPDIRLPITGVVLDLELYGRRLEGQFISTMVNDDAARSLFLQQKKKTSSPETFVIKLTKEKLWKKYMAFVGGQASAIAFKMRQELIKNNQNQKLAFAVYTPSITTDWFFKSFFKGLVPVGESLHWFSFNTNFSRIKRQVQHEFGGMRIDHSAVVMLSKITDNQTGVARLLRHLASYNEGLWFNRWSRIAEPHDPAAWHYVEQPRMFEPASKHGFMRELASVGYEPFKPLQ